MLLPSHCSAVLCEYTRETGGRRIRIEKRRSESDESAVKNCSERGLFIGAGFAMARRLLILPTTMPISHSQVPNICIQKQVQEPENLKPKARGRHVSIVVLITRRQCVHKRQLIYSSYTLKYNRTSIQYG